MNNLQQWRKNSSKKNALFTHQFALMAGTKGRAVRSSVTGCMEDTLEGQLVPLYLLDRANLHPSAREPLSISSRRRLRRGLRLRKAKMDKEEELICR